MSARLLTFLGLEDCSFYGQITWAFSRQKFPQASALKCSWESICEVLFVFQRNYLTKTTEFYMLQYLKPNHE